MTTAVAVGAFGVAGSLRGGDVRAALGRTPNTDATRILRRIRRVATRGTAGGRGRCEGSRYIADMNTDCIAI